MRSLVCALLTLAIAAPADARKVTLAELIDMARKRGAQVAIAEAQLGQSEATLSEQKRNYAPYGDLSYYLTAAPNVQCQTPDGVMNSPSTGLTDQQFREKNCINTVGDTGQNISYFSLNFAGPAMGLDIHLTQPLFTFGKIEYAVRAGKHGVNAAEHAVDAARLDAELLAVRGYWGLKAAQAGIALAKDAREQIDPWEKKINDDLDAPKPRFSQRDLFRLKSAIGTLDNRLADLVRLESQAKEGLRVLVGEDIELDDAELDAVEVDEQPLAYYQELALSHRPELRQLDEGVLALADVARARRSEMLPNLALVAGLTYRYAPTIEDSTNAFVNHANIFGYGGALALSQPLDFIQKLGHLNHANADAETILAQRRGMRDLIRFEIARAYADLVEARTRVETTHRNQRMAQGWLSSEREKMELGTADPGDDVRGLVEAARAYFEQRGAWFQAILDKNIAAAVLRRSSGAEVTRR